MAQNGSDDSSADKLVLVGVNYNPFWPFGRTEEEIAIRRKGTDPFEVSEFSKRQYDKVIERGYHGA